MRRSGHAFAPLLLALSALFPTVAIAAIPQHFAGDRLVDVSLTVEDRALGRGASSTLAVRFAPKPGWHIYWQNSGDSGAPPTIAWSLPHGVTVGSPLWPIPERIVTSGIATYIYARPTTLLLPIRVDPSARLGSNISLRADLSWLVCQHVCIPGRGHLARSIAILARPPHNSAREPSFFIAARQALPQRAPAGLRVDADATSLRIAIPRTNAGISLPFTATFFPNDAATIAQSQPQRLESDGGRTVLVVPRPVGAAQAREARIRGVLRLDVVDGDHPRLIGYTVDAIATPAPMTALPTLLAAFVLAFLGGVVLNVMPCLFPVLSFKALGLIRDHEPAMRRKLAFVYALGVVCSSAALGIALVILRSSGHALGWGFQWQSPIFVGSIALLVFALALSLSGVFEIVVPLPTIVARRGPRRDALGAFTDGAFVTLVASSCTAPFMGAALGFALAAPAWAALAVFIALGLGIALPYVAITTVPAFATRLPKPGAWMVGVRRILAFPLYATTAWLIWIFSKQTGSNASALLLAALFFTGAASVAFGAAQAYRSWARRLACFGAAALCVAIGLVTSSRALSGELAAKPTLDATTVAFSPSRLASLRARHGPVLVDITAAWCITCQINERFALADTSVERRLKTLHVAVLRGDWTLQDPTLTAYLQTFHRVGVPLYAYYRDNGQIDVWPQLLTPSAVIDRLGDATGVARRSDSDAKTVSVSEAGRAGSGAVQLPGTCMTRSNHERTA